MIHVGDITKLNGAELPVVDVVTGGSPCQDLSVAGKRAGLAGERSGLFMEQVRIVKEMREHDRSTGRTGYLTRPRYMLWENVPGAFSSNKGEDFRAVLEEIAKVEESNTVIPGPPKGKWSHAGCIVGDGWSIAWRLHDAQFWGVPQRRKRIALVADFGGQSAPEILFERKGLSGDSEQSGSEREGTTADVKGSVAATITSTYGRNWNGNAGAYNGENFVFERAISFQERAGKPGGGKGILIQDERIGALSTLNNQSVCCLNDQGGSQMGVTEDVTGTLRAEEHGHQPVVYGISSYDSNAARDYKDPQVVAYGLDRASFNQGENAKYGFSVDKEMVGAQTARGPGAVCEGLGWNSIARRLTPLECERLQGFPDGWTDIGEWTDSKGKKRKCSDSARYKALGNSIAIPFWFYILRRMAAQYERPATLGSLFDGIGGFPLCWERCNGKGTAIWASEIEEFPIAVTKKRFGDS